MKRREGVADSHGPASHRVPGPIIGAFVSAAVGFIAGVIVNHYSAVLIWDTTPLHRFSWSISRERNLEVLVIIANCLLVVMLLIVAVRQLVKKGFRPSTALLFGFSVGCLGYLLLGLWAFARLVL